MFFVIPEPCFIAPLPCHFECRSKFFKLLWGATHTVDDAYLLIEKIISMFKVTLDPEADGIPMCNPASL